MSRYLAAVGFFLLHQVFIPSGFSQGLAGPQAPAAKATIEGTVLRSPNGEPLARAQITITRLSPAPPQAGQPAALPGGQQPGPPAAANTPGAASPNPTAGAPAATASIAPVLTDDSGRFQL